MMCPILVTEMKIQSTSTDVQQVASRQVEACSEIAFSGADTERTLLLQSNAVRPAVSW